MIYSIVAAFVYLVIGFLVGKKHQVYTKQTYFPKLNLFILGGWIAMLPLSNDIWINDKSFEFSFIIVVITLLFLGILIYSMYFFRLKQIKPSITQKSIISRIINQLLLSFPISLVIGSIFLQFSLSSTIYNKEFYNINSKEKYTIISKISDLGSNKLLESIINHDSLLQEDKSKISDTKKFTYILSEKEKSDIRCYYDNYSTYKDSLHKKSKSLLENYQFIKNINLSNLLREYSKEQTKSNPFDSKLKNVFNNFLPTVVVVKIRYFTKIHLFPRLLILGSLLAFIVGYFIQFVSVENE